ncbi:DUF3883 domain-containing protein [Bradyrhizobium diazoefficiens]|uniref:DUF3883 domain-containing protein n=1 Tax=Bradyrhizobium diazoefficiens TaxID=1355477 RepID=UPI00190A95BF|nr:DUF3883 domain-containing protein [Bradyrhizobium diazoefficiens]QQO35378.1 DUF3883 domain-containing protein [Bradyrhizobium diazoefficiens]
MPPAYDAKLKEFSQRFDSSFEDVAAQCRGAFLRAFPIDRLKNLTLDGYVMGKGTPSFCTYVEAKTKPWANILGATAMKFGIYFGKAKPDTTMKYRFHKRFSSKEQAFTAVKMNLLDLIDAGRSQRFSDIDDIEISQNFKAKILSLYFPELYLNVCSKEHIETLSTALGLPEDSAISEQQHLLLQAKLENRITKSWSNPKFMTFLYNTYIRAPDEQKHVSALHKRNHRRINIDEMLENRNKIGKLSEDFALKWEKERLEGADHKALIKLIKDCRDMLGCGYDFVSYTAPGKERFIEVKSAGKNRTAPGYRFFLSETEHKISLTANARDSYYFYLVFFDQDGKPYDLRAWKAEELYAISDLGPNGYVVSFDWEDAE